jgi:hypothetical protein
VIPLHPNETLDRWIQRNGVKFPFSKLLRSTKLVANARRKDKEAGVSYKNLKDYICKDYIEQLFFNIQERRCWFCQDHMYFYKGFKDDESPICTRLNLLKPFVRSNVVFLCTKCYIIKKRFGFTSGSEVKNHKLDNDIMTGSTCTKCKKRCQTDAFCKSHPHCMDCRKKKKKSNKENVRPNNK